MATIPEVIKALEALGLRAEEAITTSPDPEAINVWVTPDARHPIDTIWPPKGENGWVWGGNYQHGTYADADAESVATRVSATLPSS